MLEPNGLKKILKILLLLCGYLTPFAFCDIDYNTINDDGSYSFRHTNDDIGGFYHSASASPDNIVRGRYGSRNPATGQVEEVVYTAGPRGFRANGPKIHRKMDLAQYPTRPVGTPDDPLADPYDDPSYSFSYRTGGASRSENGDSTGRVRGLYSYLDDIGERHSVRYAAGAGTGFEVSNAVPDNPISIGYSAPLYKSHPKARGKMAVQRGPNGSYKLVAAGPDHRRAESRAPDGYVRGTYSYLDDKGVQRTVEYVAGAGIGYRIVQNRVGPGTHVNPSVSDFRLTDTDFRLSNDYGRGAGDASSLTGPSSGGGSGSGSNRGGGGGGVVSGDSSGGTGAGSASVGSLDDDRNYSKPGRGRDGLRGGNTNSLDKDSDNAELPVTEDDNGFSSRDKADRTGTPTIQGRGKGGGSGTFGSRSGNRPDISRGSTTRQRDRNRTTASGSGSGSGNRAAARAGESSSSSRHTGGSGGYNYEPPTAADNYNFNDDDVGSLPPLITANRNILEVDRERDWVERHRDSTVIKNVGKWYIGLPPGQSVRAHVQNIDLLPLGGRRVPSPSEALRQDEIAEMVASLENGSTFVR